jgi:hypothetical protein
MIKRWQPGNHIGVSAGRRACEKLSDTTPWLEERDSLRIIRHQQHIAGPAAARITQNGIELNKLATNGMQLNRITANGVQVNRIASNKLAVNSALSVGLGVDAVRADLIGSIELVGVELPH